MRHDRSGPEDYFSTERGSWKKNWTGRLPVALVFPNTYRVGMSNLGFQLVYDLLNNLSEIVCERFFLPDDDMKPISVESSRPLSDFPVVLTAFSFEKDIVFLLRILLAGDIEPLAEMRVGQPVSTQSPLIIAGGVACSINPEPLSPFVDLMIIGDADPSLTEMISGLSEGGLPQDRRGFLRDCGKTIAGCYAPGEYDFQYDAQGKLEKIIPTPGLPARISVSRSGLGDVAGCSKVVTPAAEFSNLFLVELGRGCSRGCRFCAAGYVSRPPRLWSSEAVLVALEERPEAVDRVGLLGMEMARPEDLSRIVASLRGRQCRLSFSSLRADRLDDSLIKLLADSRLKTVALAPDGGSERLRKVINKGITAEDVLVSAEKLVAAGIFNLKLYFMIGLPTETDEDLVEMIKLVREVRQVMDVPGRAKGRLSMLTLSINPFVPKAWTPFQYAAFTEIGQLKYKMKFLRRNLSAVTNLKIMGEKPDSAYLQAVIARGDRRLTPVLLHLARNGGNWRHVFRRGALRPEDFACRERGKDEVFCWEVVDHGIRRQYLWHEYQRAIEEKETSPCNTSTCKKCGCCF